MILDDGSGLAIDTESKPLTLKQQIAIAEQQVGELKAEIGKWGVDRKQRQQLKTKLENTMARLKKLRNQYDKEEKKKA